MNRLCYATILSLLVLVGCAGRTATGPSMFLLDSNYPDTPTGHDAEAAAAVLIVDTVAMAPFLDDSSIVYQTDAHRLVMANNNRWASPLSTQLTDGLYAALNGRVKHASIRRGSRDGSASAMHLVTRVDEFMGHYDGYAHVAGQWQLLAPNGARVAGDRFERRVPLKDDGYDALVDSLSRGWRLTAESLVPRLTDALSER